MFQLVQRRIQKQIYIHPQALRNAEMPYDSHRGVSITLIQRIKFGAHQGSVLSLFTSMSTVLPWLISFTSIALCAIYLLNTFKFLTPTCYFH